MLREVTSLQHPLVKHLVKLREKKEYRLLCSSVVVSGNKLIEELSEQFFFKTLLIEKGYTPEFSYRAEQTFCVPYPLIKKITALVHPETLVAEIALPAESTIEEKSHLLILDGITDPGNMGTLLRSALALGWDAVLITPNSTDPFNDKALRAAKGATFKIPLKQLSWEQIQSLCISGKWRILAADILGEPFDRVVCSAPLALVLGNETFGISAQIKSKATPIAIPMAKQMQSLNVASAGAILLHSLKIER